MIVVSVDGKPFDGSKNDFPYPYDPELTHVIPGPYLNVGSTVVVSDDDKEVSGTVTVIDDDREDDWDEDTCYFFDLTLEDDREIEIEVRRWESDIDAELNTGAGYKKWCGTGAYVVED